MATDSFSTYILRCAVSPYYHQHRNNPETADDGPVQTPITHSRQMSEEDLAEVHRLFRDIFPPSWPTLTPDFECEVATLRDEAHKRCSCMNSSYLEEIQQFFLEVRTVVSMISDGESSRLGDSEHVEIISEGMNTDPYHQGQMEDTVSDSDSESDESEEGDDESDYESDGWGSEPESSLQELASRNAVSRRQVEGDCTICFSPLKSEEVLTSLEVPEGISSDINSSINGKDSFDKGNNELVWCRASCGINYHFDCFKAWVGQFEKKRRATCPSCRRRWH